LNIKCVFGYSLQLFSETFLILRRTERDIKNLYWFSFNVPVILVRFLWNLNFLYRLSKNTEIPNVMKIRPMGAEFFRAEGRTHMTKLIAAFRNFAKATKSLFSSPTHQRPQYSTRTVPALRRLVCCSLYLQLPRMALLYRKMSVSSNTYVCFVSYSLYFLTNITDHTCNARNVYCEIKNIFYCWSVRLRPQNSYQLVLLTF
jgi:hypothetical protein